MKKIIFDTLVSEEIDIIDSKLSNRFINLDPKGYFIIQINRDTNEIIAELYSNNIDNKGRAVNPETGEPLPCKGESERQPLIIFKGSSAKQVGIKITEDKNHNFISLFDHALYIGRELQKAEYALKTNTEYIQD